jgi:hypothetical protein
MLLSSGLTEATTAATPSQEGVSCEDTAATRAAGLLACIPEDQLQTILSYSPLVKNEVAARETLAAAAELSECVNRTESFPEHPQQREDFQCLQHRLLEFYEQARQSRAQVEFQYQDVLASSSLRIHLCMIDDRLPISRCLKLVEEALNGYRSVFKKAATEFEAGVAESPGPPREVPSESILPEFSELVSFVDLALENSRRFPLLLGTQFGASLGPILCDAYRLYPEQRAYIAYHYNVLVRFDGGNMAASVQLYAFMQKLMDLFRPVAELPTFLQFHPADWSSSSPPCAEEDWVLVFPEFRLLPSLRLPDRNRLQSILRELKSLLANTAQFKDNSMHLWKPFQQYGMLLSRLAQSLKAASLRNPKIWEIRHMLMQEARDAFLLRAVAPEKHPLDPEELQASVSRQIDDYGYELLGGLRFDSLIDFAEEYLEAGRILLTDAQKQQLNRLLTIAYTAEGNDAQALVHLEQSNLQAGELVEIQRQLRELGIGVQLQ